VSPGGCIQIPVLPCWIHMGAMDADDLSIWPRRSKTSAICIWSPWSSDIVALCLSLATASWAGQYCRMVSSAGVTTLADARSARLANLRYSGQLKRESFHRGWSGNCLRKMTESCSRITLSSRSRRRNPVPARSSRTTSLSSRSGWKDSIRLSHTSTSGHILEQRASSGSSWARGTK
jgi:hypothetical protein